MEKENRTVVIKNRTRKATQPISQVMSSNKSPFSREFYSRHVGKAFLILFMLYGYVQLRYAYDDALYNLGKLKDELADARYVSISTWGELTSKNKPEIVRGKLENNSQLITADEPPYLLK